MVAPAFRFLKDDTGATAIEYGLIAAGISIAIIATVFALGTELNDYVLNCLERPQLSSPRALLKPLDSGSGQGVFCVVATRATLFSVPVAAIRCVVIRNPAIVSRSSLQQPFLMMMVRLRGGLTICAPPSPVTGAALTV